MPTPAEIQSRYNIPVHSSIEGDGIWEVRTELGNLELRLYDATQTTARDQWAALLTFLTENDHPAPHLIETSEGVTFSQWEDRSGILSTTVFGRDPSFEPKFFFQLGATVGRLHALDVYEASLPVADYNVKAEREKFRMQDADPEVRAWEGYGSVREELVAAWDRMPDFGNHPSVLINTAPFQWSAVLTREGVALENWDHAGIGSAVMDIGSLFSFQGILPAPQEPLRESVAGAFLHGYQSCRKLTTLEIDELPDAIALGVLTYAIERWREPIEESTWLRAKHILDHRSQIADQLRRLLASPARTYPRPESPTTSSTIPPEPTKPTPEAFEKRYGLPVDRVSRLSQRAWLVRSGDREWVLRLHNPELQIYHPGEIAALEFLESLDYPAPRLLPAHGGNVLIPWGDDIGYTVSYLLGESIDRSLETTREIGRLIAGVHTLNVSDTDIPETQHSVVVRRDQFRRNEVNPEIRTWEGFGAIHQELSSAWEDLPDFKDLPQVLIHSDLLYHNVIRTPNGDLALIDWDGTGLGSAIQDIGYFFKSYAVSPGADGLRTSIAHAFLAGYTEIRPLSQDEWKAIPDAMIYGSIFVVLWYERVYEPAWFRTRHILAHRDAIGEKLSAIRESL